MFCLALLFVFLDFVTSASAKITYEDYRVLRLFPETDAQVKWVWSQRNSLDFWSANDVMVTSYQEVLLINDFNTMGMKWKILIPNVQAIIDAQDIISQRQLPEDNIEAGISFAKYNRHEEIVAYVTQLQTKHPELVNIRTLANSSEGRTLPLVEISSGGDGTRPIILIDAGIHAREWIAPAMALYIIHQLVENSSNADLLNNADWHIIPLLNPDGYEYTHTDVRLWRKTRSEHKCILSPDPKQGVDGNRNFDFHWKEVGASDDPCMNDYAGPIPFSEPETSGLRDHVMAHADRIKLYLAMHSHGNYFLFPWGYTSELPSDYEKLTVLAEAANAAQMAAGGINYTIGSSYNVLSPGAGGSDDWVKGVGGVDFSYTIELPSGGTHGFDMPPSQIARTVTTFFPAVRVMGEYINKMN